MEYEWSFHLESRGIRGVLSVGFGRKKGKVFSEEKLLIKACSVSSPNGFYMGEVHFSFYFNRENVELFSLFWIQNNFEMKRCQTYNFYLPDEFSLDKWLPNMPLKSEISIHRLLHVELETPPWSHIFLIPTFQNYSNPFK